MDYALQLGRHLMFGFAGTEPDADSITLIQKYKASNIILFAHNIESAEQLRALCERLQRLVMDATGNRALIFIDQEGGVVSRMPKGATTFPSAMAISATGDEASAHTAGHYTALELAALGINCNLAPVMDVNTNPDNPVIGVRSYGNTPAEVSRYALAFVKGQSEAGVLSCVKHFPGHGDTAVDSHLGLPCVDKSRTELDKCELLPFYDAIKTEVPCIMAAHILYPQLDDTGVPATMSRTILTSLLREELHYDGLIVTDCMEMGAIKNHYGTEKGFVKALAAGADIVCISHTPSVALGAMELAQNALQSGQLTAERLQKAAQQIEKVRARFASVDAPFALVGCEAHSSAALDILQAGATRTDANGALPPIGKDTFCIGCNAYRATIAQNVADDENSFAQQMAQYIGGGFMVTSTNPDSSEIALALAQTHLEQTVVMNTYNGHLNKGQIDLANALCSAQRKLIVFALRNPYDLPLIDNAAFKYALFEYDDLSLNVAKAILGGKLTTGKCSSCK